MKREKVERRIIDAAREARRLEILRRTYRCAHQNDRTRSICTESELYFEGWCPGCLARHEARTALYVARRKLRTAVDCLERLEAEQAEQLAEALRDLGGTATTGQLALALGVTDKDVLAMELPPNVDLVSDIMRLYL